MTTTTLTPDDITVPLIALLKADATLLAAVGDEIREDQWMGDEFAYPGVRVGGNQFNIAPVNGNCFGLWFDISGAVLVFTEGRSSRQCQQVMGMVGRAIQGTRLDTTDLSSLALRIAYIPPIAYMMNAWRGEVFVTGRVKEKT